MGAEQAMKTTLISLRTPLNAVLNIKSSIMETTEPPKSAWIIPPKPLHSTHILYHCTLPQDCSCTLFYYTVAVQTKIYWLEFGDKIYNKTKWTFSFPTKIHN